MYIIYEYAACIVVALIATSLPFAVFAICLLLKNGAECLSRTLPKLAHSVGSVTADGLSRRILGKPLEPAVVPVVYRREGGK
jgi:2-keto-4-pentenoate hydratase